MHKRSRAELNLLEEQIESINRFPDQNPNPVLRTDWEGRLLYANPASASISRTVGASVGQPLPSSLFSELVAAAAESPPRAVEIQCGLRTFALLAVPVPDLAVYNLYGTDVTAAKVVAKFPEGNPNPVLRAAPDGTLIYANAASAQITSSLGIEVGDPLPAELFDQIRRRTEEHDTQPIEVTGDGRAYALKPVVIPEFGFTNIYGTDITALRAVDKFPNENPNPVLRVSRERILTYANAASALVLSALGAKVGDRLDDELFERLQAVADRQTSERIEVESGGRLFSLKVVAVFEFDSINIYGTDITADRENERLLLNILPPSIADRLKQGEMVIADRFEQMTVLFADVVGFTPFAATLPATEVVTVLNAIFAMFDRLAEKYELEKIKTIGDAYMVIGGMAADDSHVERVADMALEMLEAMESYRTTAGKRLEIRVGMHIGPTIAGVIGLRKFIYDVWGDTVNTASRMESSGIPGRVQVTEDTRRLLHDRYEFEPRGTVDVKGKGPMSTYYLLRRRPKPSSPRAAEARAAR
jgi:class 3 adenylate cyclase